MKMQYDIYLKTSVSIHAAIMPFYIFASRRRKQANFGSTTMASQQREAAERR